MKIEIANARVAESPSYYVKDAEGYDVPEWHFYIEARDAAGQVWTHNHIFPATRHHKGEAYDLVAKVEDRGVIDTRYWEQVDLWAPYKTPQTPEEERRSWEEAELERPANPF